MKDHEKYFGINSRNRQVPGTIHRFSCGCSGKLPKIKGVSNKFVRWCRHSWSCRVSYILHSSKNDAKRGGYSPIPRNTPHHIIRSMMAESRCVLCDKKLTWKLGAGKTPHFHHDHETGKMLGFSHARCNVFDLKRRVIELEAKLSERNSDGIIQTNSRTVNSS